MTWYQVFRPTFFALRNACVASAGKPAQKSAVPSLNCTTGSSGCSWASGSSACAAATGALRNAAADRGRVASTATPGHTIGESVVQSAFGWAGSCRVASTTPADRRRGGHEGGEPDHDSHAHGRGHAGMKVPAATVYTCR